MQAVDILAVKDTVVVVVVAANGVVPKELLMDLVVFVSDRSYSLVLHVVLGLDVVVVVVVVVVLLIYPADCLLSTVVLAVSWGWIVFWWL